VDIILLCDNFFILFESPRQSHKMQGKPPECTPSQLERIQTERLESTRSKSLEESETSIISQYETVESEVNPTQEIESGLVDSSP